MFLEWPASWGFHFYLDFTFTASCSTISGSPCRDSNLVTHCLTSVALWNHITRLYANLSKSCRFHSWNTSTIWTTLSINAANLGWSSAPLDDNCTGFWLTSRLTLGKYFNRVLILSKEPFKQHSQFRLLSFKCICVFTKWTFWLDAVLPSGHLSYCPSSVQEASL